MSFRVSDVETGEAIAGAVVRPRGIWYSTSAGDIGEECPQITSDPQGLFTVRTAEPAHEVLLRIEAAGYCDVSRRVAVPADPSAAEINSVSMSRPSEFRGRVTGSDGRSMIAVALEIDESASAAAIEARLLSWDAASAHGERAGALVPVDARGGFVIAGLPRHRRFVVFAVRPEGSRGSPVVTTSLPSGVDLELATPAE